MPQDLPHFSRYLEGIVIETNMIKYRNMMSFVVGEKSAIRVANVLWNDPSVLDSTGGFSCKKKYSLEKHGLRGWFREWYFLVRFVLIPKHCWPLFAMKHAISRLSYSPVDRWILGYRISRWTLYYCLLGGSLQITQPYLTRVKKTASVVSVQLVTGVRTCYNTHSLTGCDIQVPSGYLT